MPDSKPPPSVAGSGNFSVNQQGGTVNQTYINQQMQRLKFSEQLGRDLMSKIPRDKPVYITAVGSPSDLQVGADFADFFRANGYKVAYMSVGMLFPQPERQLTLVEHPDAFAITVAPSVR